MIPFLEVSVRVARTGIEADMIGFISAGREVVLKRLTASELTFGPATISDHSPNALIVVGFDENDSVGAFLVGGVFEQRDVEHQEGAPIREGTPEIESLFDPLVKLPVDKDLDLGVDKLVQCLEFVPVREDDSSQMSTIETAPVIGDISAENLL